MAKYFDPDAPDPGVLPEDGGPYYPPVCPTTFLDLDTGTVEGDDDGLSSAYHQRLITVFDAAGETYRVALTVEDARELGERLGVAVREIDEYEGRLPLI